MAADRPKQYLTLAGRTVLEWTLTRFLSHPCLKGIVVCLAADDPYWPQLSCSRNPHLHRVDGGVERADSVLNGLNFLLHQGHSLEDWVLVHDAARPNLAREDLDRLLQTLQDDPVGGLLASPVQDTLKQVDSNGRVRQTIDRACLWQAYTPQMFRLGPLQEALDSVLQAGIRVTDEASAMEWSRQAPRLVRGRSDNIKITTPQDLMRLQSLFQTNR